MLKDLNEKLKTSSLQDKRSLDSKLSEREQEMSLKEREVKRLQELMQEKEQ